MIENPPIHDFPNAQGAVALDAVVVQTRLPKVFIALCTRDWQVESHTSESVRIIANTCKCEVVVRYMMNDGVARSRNNLAAMFLESDCTHLFFLDNDIIIEPWQFQKLLDADKDLVCALYPKKQGALAWVINHLSMNETPDKFGRMRVKHAGTGAWLLERKALEKHIAKRPEIKYVESGLTRWDVFPMHAVNGEYLSEDWFFCNRWIEDGFEIWVDTTCQLRHIGKIIYPLQFTLSDEEVVDIIQNRYGIWPDVIRSFIASGERSPGLWGGHRHQFVRLWPKDFPVGDLHQGDVLAGCYDFPPFVEMSAKEAPPPPVIIDLGADCGALVRWAQKRWVGVTIHAYEENPEKLKWLETTADGLRNAGTLSTITTSGQIPSGADWSALPKATVLKIDLPGREREVIEALMFSKRMPEFDAVLIRYTDEMTAFFVKTMVEQTHVLHCYQRNRDGRGLMKFMRRELVPEIKADTPNA
jgi:hypothetical protein